MPSAEFKPVDTGEQPSPILIHHLRHGSNRRHETEQLIRSVFAQRYAARVNVFAPDLMMVEENGQPIAATGWRSAHTGTLFLERYLDDPIETLLTALTGQRHERQRIVEISHLASEKPGGSLPVIMNLARHLNQYGYEWVVFTATQQLIGIFTKLGLPLLALAKADPARLGIEANNWGSYYDTNPVVVAGPIRLALERFGSGA